MGIDLTFNEDAPMIVHERVPMEFTTRPGLSRVRLVAQYDRRLWDIVRTYRGRSDFDENAARVVFKDCHRVLTQLFRVDFNENDPFWGNAPRCVCVMIGDILLENFIEACRLHQGDETTLMIAHQLATYDGVIEAVQWLIATSDQFNDDVIERLHSNARYHATQVSIQTVWNMTGSSRMLRTVADELRELIGLRASLFDLEIMNRFFDEIFLGRS